MSELNLTSFLPEEPNHCKELWSSKVKFVSLNYNMQKSMTKSHPVRGTQSYQVCLHITYIGHHPESTLPSCPDTTCTTVCSCHAQNTSSPTWQMEESNECVQWLWLLLGKFWHWRSCKNGTYNERAGLWDRALRILLRCAGVRKGPSPGRW